MINVIIVDDEVSILNGLERNIKWEEFGMDIAGTASNGKAALELIRRYDVNLLITDVCMPGMTGLELIEEAVKIRKGIHCVLISAFNEFEYVHKAIQMGIVNYLLKPLNTNELTETLEKVIDTFNRNQLMQADSVRSVEVFRENLLNRWVAGSIDHRELCERANLAKVNVYAKEYCVITTKLLEYVNDELPEKLRIMTEGLDSILWFIPRKYIFIDAACHIIVLIYGNTLEDAIARIKYELEAGLAGFCRPKRIKSFTVVGDKVIGSKNVNRSYVSARKLLDYSVLKASGEVLCAGELKSSLADKYISAPDFTEFEKRIYNMDLEGCLDFADNLLLRFDKTDNIDLTQWKAVMIELLFSILAMLRKALGENEELPDSFKKLFNEFENIHLYSQLQSWLHHTIREAIEYISLKKSDNSPIVNLVLKFLDSNYYRDISIKSIADKYKVNASYLGQIFKKETGKIYSDYLNELRLRHAVQLLSSTNLKVNEIAQKVGYSNTSYFNLIFRNEYLVTPAQYRINLLNKE